MKTSKFNSEEEMLVESYKNEEWHSVQNFPAEKSRYQEYARSTFRKDRRVIDV